MPEHICVGCATRCSGASGSDINTMLCAWPRRSYIKKTRSFQRCTTAPKVSTCRPKSLLCRSSDRGAKPCGRTHGGYSHWLYSQSSVGSFSIRHGPPFRANSTTSRTSSHRSIHQRSGDPPSTRSCSDREHLRGGRRSCPILLHSSFFGHQ